MKQSEGVLTENFNVILDTVYNNVMRDLRVGTLARVTSVNELTINVLPVVMEKINTKDGQKYIALPELRDIPYISGQTPEINDYVVCLHLDRSHDDINIFENKIGYAKSGSNRHNINDCIAIVIKTKNDSWKELGVFETASSIDFSEYSSIKIVLVSENTILNSVTYDLVEDYNYIVSSGEHYAKITNEGIHEISENTKIVVYAK